MNKNSENASKDLIKAIEEENISKITKIVLENPETLDKQNDYDQTPLMYACELEKSNIAIKLIELGADPKIRDSYEKTPLMSASFNGDNSLVKALVENSDIHAMDDEGNTALLFAAKHGKSEVVETLIKNDANPEHFNEFEESSLTLAAQLGHKEVVGVLVSFKVDLNITNSKEQTALHLSTEYHEIVELLVNSGADLDARDLWGSSPLDEAKNNNHSSSTMILSRAGAELGNSLFAVFETGNESEPEIKSKLEETKAKDSKPVKDEKRVLGHSKDGKSKDKPTSEKAIELRDKLLRKSSSKSLDKGKY